MNSHRFAPVLAAVVVLAVTGCDPMTPAGAAGTARLRAAVAGMPVSVEHRSGYARSKFEHWTDAGRSAEPPAGDRPRALRSSA